MALTVEALISRRVVDESGCWIWTGARDGHGYGMLWCDGRVRKVSHLALEMFTGQVVGRGLEACHRCDQPACFNPDHLWIGTHAENQADMVRKGRSTKGRPVGSSAANARKTVCPYGHEYTEANTYRRADGGRSCLTCRQLRDRGIDPKEVARAADR